MALTQAQWEEKLKSWVPRWFFELVDNQDAHFSAMARLMEECQLELDNHIAETMIAEAQGTFLDQHGDERGIIRLPSEADSFYAERIRNFINQSNCPAIKALVDMILVAGESTIIENFDNELYFDRGTFFDRNDIFLKGEYNRFTVIIPEQIHDPFDFMDRDTFADRDHFFGGLSSIELFNLIYETIFQSRALGVGFSLLEEVGG